MAYQSQLVVRTKDLQGSQVVDRVKEMAEEQGKTYSEMALELLARGLAADEAGGEPVEEVDSEPAPVEEPVASAGESSVVDEEEETGELELDEASEIEGDDPSDWELAADGKNGAAPEPSEAETAQPVDVDLPEDDEPETIASACLEQLEANNQPGAVQILAYFFSKAGPVEGGQVKDALQDELDESTYESLLEGLRETEEYRSYRKRVIFGG